MLTNRQKGEQGEIKAMGFLEDKGYYIIDKNYRTRSGEIDIIAEYNNAIVFVEVKLRSSLRFGVPSEAVNFKKASKIKTVAFSYLKDNNLLDHTVRFDIIEVYKSENFRINHIENAF
ncbi:MAG: YraN family protein [Clostridium sp.]|uniref:YraN family protein n=1 Tax=Clostridium sp. TaxID=1506 RepID=UPI002FC61D92